MYTYSSSTVCKQVQRLLQSTNNKHTASSNKESPIKLPATFQTPKSNFTFSASFRYGIGGSRHCVTSHPSVQYNSLFS